MILEELPWTEREVAVAIEGVSLAELVNAVYFIPSTGGGRGGGGDLCILTA